MALLDEQLVDEWLNRRGFFTMRGVKSGIDEIDLLAVKLAGNQLECWHVEVQVSYRPIGYIGGDTNARRRSEEEVSAGVAQWVEKKFTNDRKHARRNLLVPNVSWQYVFVHGVVRDETELTYMSEHHGIKLVPYKDVLVELRDDNTGNSSSSVASNIAEMLRYMK